MTRARTRKDSLPPPDRLLTREGFGEAVRSRDRGLCVACGKPGMDAHHIVERKLWPDGGYYLGNGALVCEGCHLEAEMTVIGTDRLREAAGIVAALLPPGLDPSRSWDKWGNEILADGTRSPGPLFGDPGVAKILARGKALRLFPGGEWRHGAGVAERQTHRV